MTEDTYIQAKTAVDSNNFRSPTQCVFCDVVDGELTQIGEHNTPICERCLRALTCSQRIVDSTVRTNLLVYPCKRNVCKKKHCPLYTESC